MFYICHFKTAMQETKIRDYLSENGISPVRKRIKIMSYLISKRNHATAEMIYIDLSSEIAGLSKTTVYNTLNLFVQEGIARALNIDSNEVRYDADTSLHGHFKCNDCGKIYDFALNKAIMPDISLNNFRLDDYQFSIKGLCPICLKLKKA
jgi:Fe2+ or Zn2+ uptake regulation protein